ncbi:methyltransferase domain-containing protein [Alphaproteobacteria bacterium]|nr:methyltransferase domain-containing protein [Alphaproteobacteria bacterium]
MTISSDKFDEKVEIILEELREIQGSRAGDICILQAGCMIICAQQKILENLNDEPFSRYEKLFESILNLKDNFRPLLENSFGSSFDNIDFSRHTDSVTSLFENAWTQYTEKTFDHSLELVTSRLTSSGFDENYFAGKTCFDGGCGTGRLSIAMSLLGADKVIGADVGKQSLDFMQVHAKRHGATISSLQCDITSLDFLTDPSFDFVASYGVLHHTEKMRDGLREHMRILKSGGYLWLYLYGAGGVYWSLYDKFRTLMRCYSPEEISATLRFLGIREGLIYTFLDNFLAPRSYLSKEEVISIIGEGGGAFIRGAKGNNTVDDYDMQTNSKYGKFILGPDCEHRYIFRKI